MSYAPLAINLAQGCIVGEVVLGGCLQLSRRALWLASPFVELVTFTHPEHDARLKVKVGVGK